MVNSGANIRAIENLISLLLCNPIFCRRMVYSIFLKYDFLIWSKLGISIYLVLWNKYQGYGLYRMKKGIVWSWYTKNLKMILLICQVIESHLIIISVLHQPRISLKIGKNWQNRHFLLYFWYFDQDTQVRYTCRSCQIIG